MKAYSQDLRHRVLRALDAGKSQVEVAKTFAVSISTIKRYLKQRLESGHVLPKAIPGRPTMKGSVLQAHLRTQLERITSSENHQKSKIMQVMPDFHPLL